MNRGTRIGIGVVGAVVFLVAIIYGWRAFANNRKLNQLQAKMEEMASQPRSEGQPDRGQWEAFREIRQEVRSLPESYQEQFWQSMGNRRQGREVERLDQYFALSVPERKRHLDKLIDESEQRRKEREARQRTREAEQARNPQRTLASTNSNSNNNRGGSGPPDGANARGGGRGWRGGSMSARLDSTTPEYRAKREQFRRDMEQRRRERGIPVRGR
jgi:hypothetical protein